jgi:hypothetical protein
MMEILKYLNVIVRIHGGIRAVFIFEVYLLLRIFNHKEEEIISFAREWMELEIIILIKISQIQRDK